jgi:flagellar basal body-associated protein FliL
MSPLERLRWAIAPDQRRSLSIVFGGLAVFVALGGLAALFVVPRAIAVLMALTMLAALVVGACGMVGYLRWFFRSEADQHTRR